MMRCRRLSHVDQLLEVSERVAASALKERAKLLPCLATTLDSMCLRTFVGTFGAKAFRRPLSVDEIDAYLSYFDREAAVLGDRVAALGYLLRAFLLSPGFLFRTELGSDPSAGDSELTAWEKASALSYLLTDGPPDAALSAAATRGALATAGDLEREARRLLTAPGAAKGILELFEQYLDFGAVSSVDKNAKLFPEWNDNLAADLSAETRAFIVEVLWRDDGRLRTLFGAPFSILGERTAKLYGVVLVGRNLQRAELPEGQRLGLLGQGSFLASMARADEGDIVQRGRYVRERLLCQTLPPPPPEVNAVPPKPDGMLTQRDRLARHSSDPSCAGCHKLMDPIGHLFETYDAIGKHRTLELGKPIDTRGEVVGEAGSGRRFDDALALGRVFGDLPEVRHCFATQLQAWATGTAEAAACRTDRVTRKLESTGGRVLESVIDLVTAPDFVTRR